MQTAVVALCTFPYGGVTRHIGDVFKATVRDARTLKLLGRVGDPAPAASASESRESCDVVTSEVVVADSADGQKPRRAYRRKDLIAE